LERVIVAVFTWANEAAPFKGMEKVAEAWPGLKVTVPEVAW
jgi:hypothetical protein